MVKIVAIHVVVVVVVVVSCCCCSCCCCCCCCPRGAAFCVALQLAPSRPFDRSGTHNIFCNLEQKPNSKNQNAPLMKPPGSNYFSLSRPKHSTCSHWDIPETQKPNLYRATASSLFLPIPPLYCIHNHHDHLNIPRQTNILLCLHLCRLRQPLLLTQNML